MGRNILKQPFPINTQLHRKIITAACFGVFITVFLLLFKPFQLDQLEKKVFVTSSIAYGAMTFICISVMITVVPLIFPDFFKEERWTVGKEIFYTTLIMFFIGLVNYVLSHFMIGSSLRLDNIFQFQFITVSIGILPITIFILIQQNRQLKRYSTEARSLQQKIAERSDPEPEKKIAAQPGDEPTTISIKGDYQKEELVIPEDRLLYITTANNYVKAYYLEKDKVVYSILRITMKRVEDVLLQNQNFFRCHRAYLINLARVKEVVGNAQGYKVKLHGVEEMIPVSRGLNAEFSDKLLSKKL
jgi:DNA-binding LytR/AlgR family response regulator